MARCPRCGAKITEPTKEWRYGVFDAKRYDCPNCGVWLREYYYKGKLKFILMPQKGKGIRKVKIT